MNRRDGAARPRPTVSARRPATRDADPAAPAPATVAMRCDPAAAIGMLTAQLGALAALGFAGLGGRSSDGLIVAGVLIVLALRAYCWARSWVIFDRASAIVTVRRQGWWGLQPTEISHEFANIAQVELPRTDGRLMPIRRIVLRTQTGERVLVSTIGSSIGLLDDHADAIAGILGCPVGQSDERI